MGERREAGEEFEPAWGADGWPRPVEGGLDEGDEDLLRSCLRLTPLERLQQLERVVNGLQRIRRVRRVPAD
ncbi:MAG: hypothetical protein DWQ36_06115 [Acidobacteria bacterium]|nr:MAG: hypothetical protein DWQ30_19120 [Acidobacteriota bacterium]REK09623.1 MAG: hypothetical protein DWQ36_06115 [Acidobacteriota bacterium]